MTLNTRLALKSVILALYFIKDAANNYVAKEYLLGALYTACAIIVVSEVVEYYYLRKSVLAETERKNANGQ